jgi:hypothetical protein
MMYGSRVCVCGVCVVVSSCYEKLLLRCSSTPFFFSSSSSSHFVFLAEIEGTSEKSEIIMTDRKAHDNDNDDRSRDALVDLTGKNLIRIGHVVKLDELDVNYDFEDYENESKGEGCARINADYGIVSDFVEVGNQVFLSLQDGRSVLPYTVEVVKL